MAARHKREHERPAPPYLRRHEPRQTTTQELAALAAALNSRPRKTLGWRTSAEALDEHLRSLQKQTVGEHRLIRRVGFGLDRGPSRDDRDSSSNRGAMMPFWGRHDRQEGLRWLRRCSINLATVWRMVSRPRRLPRCGCRVGAWSRCRDVPAKDAVRLALPGDAEGVACDGCPPLETLFEQFAQGGGELLVCPICLNARKLDADAFVANARLAGATPMWEWLGDETGTVFSY